MFVMLLLSVIAQIPQLNMSKLFALDLNESNDPERQLLAANTSTNSPKYSRQIDDDDASSRSNLNTNILQEQDDQSDKPKY